MHDKLILIGLGSNLPGPDGSPSRETLTAALEELPRHGVRVLRRSRWYRSAPVPKSDQPWFVNGVAVVDFDGQPEELLAILQSLEAQFGRSRRQKNEARPIDLDLLAFGDTVRGLGSLSPSGQILNLPHPELHKRAFVLLPLADVAADWRHPVSHDRVELLIARLPPNQAIEVLDDVPGRPT